MIVNLAVRCLACHKRLGAHGAPRALMRVEWTTDTPDLTFPRRTDPPEDRTGMIVLRCSGCAARPRRKRPTLIAEAEAARTAGLDEIFV